MKKTKIFVPLLMTVLFITTNHSNAAYYKTPRITAWGLAGQQEQVRGDSLFSLSNNQNNLIYTDLQGSYTLANNSDNANYVGIGLGFRRLFNTAVYGAYLFLDRDRTQQNNIFYVLSPGAELFLPDWDFRVNAYFPVSNRSKIISTFTPQPCADCGNICPDASFVVFKGHQQFENGFSILEKAGNGFDTEVGYTFHRLYNAGLHAGVYYFNFNHTNNFRNSSNTDHITGVEGRLEVPVLPMWAITLESSYDNYQHGTIMGGLRLDLYGPPHTNSDDVQRHMLDPIPRNLGSLKKGSGIPTVKVTRDNGLVLTRSNIYFFTSEGGSAFVSPSQSGTFENPLSNDQFSQAVVNAIGNNANFYFDPGTYIIRGAGATPNSQINLLMGDSLFGRNSGFQSSASGDARPLFLGRINLLEGNNTLDSIQLLNSASGAGTADLNLTALSIQNAPNVFLCNDNINATATVNGDLLSGFSNLATGINANNSQVSIQNSTISANAIVTGTIAAGANNFAAGIGSNSTAAATPANFTGNNFTLLNSTVNATASAGTVLGDNFATGIGGNADLDGIATFSGNIFTIANSTISATASVVTDNNNLNIAVGIGSNVESTFTNNIFNLSNSTVNAIASVGGDNNDENFAVGIGNSIGTLANNTINITSSIVNAIALVNGNTAALTINRAGGINLEDSTDNTVTINQSTINTLGQVNGTNNGTNFVRGVSAVGGGDIIIISNSTVNTTAIASGPGSNIAEGQAGNVISSNTTYNTSP